MGKKSSPFNFVVLNACSQIPKGKVCTYREIARALGKPRAARAVGNALNKSPGMPYVPCHRVVKSSGHIGGYAMGYKRKIALLKKEGLKLRGKKIENFGKVKHSF